MQSCSFLVLNRSQERLQDKQEHLRVIFAPKWKKIVWELLQEVTSSDNSLVVKCTKPHTYIILDFSIARKMKVWNCCLSSQRKNKWSKTKWEDQNGKRLIVIHTVKWYNLFKKVHLNPEFISQDNRWKCGGMRQRPPTASFSWMFHLTAVSFIMSIHPCTPHTPADKRAE